MSSIRHFMLIWINSPNYWIKKKCDLTRNDGLPLDERFQVKSSGGETARLPASKSERLPERTFSSRSKRLSRREWKEARQAAKQPVNLVWELSTSVSILRCCFLWCLREICLAWGCLWFQLIEYVCYNYFKMPSVLASLPVQVQSYVQGEGKEKRRSVLFRT